jgi:hypothetical protein
MPIKGDWSDHDNKRYRGKLDRIYVAPSEAYEVEYFIDHYLETRKYAISNGNRDKVAAALEKYPGRTPFKRDELNKYLDGYWSK